MTIRLFRFGKDQATPIEAYASAGAHGCAIAHGSGASHAYVVHLDAGGIIGPHPAGFDQVFLVVQGSGWVAGADGVRQSVTAGSGAFIPTGELHSKGSEAGMVAVMIQASQFKLEQQE
jgi:quercetin dioxygenase-like cupin family protein